MILGIDQGSSHTRAVLFSDHGQKGNPHPRKITGLAPLSISYPKPGYVEHDPKALLKSTFTAIRRALQKSDKKKIVAIGIATQRSALLLWDSKTGEPLSPVLSWQDRRTADTLRQWGSPIIQERTGLPLTPYYSATKLSRLLDIVGRKRKHLAAGTVNTFLIWHLTQGKSHVTDPTHAQRMLLYNIHTGQWDPELLRHFKIPEAVLPEVLPNQADFGEAIIDGYRIPITASIGDQQSSLIGLGGLHSGAANINYGTGGFFLIHTGTQAISLPGLLTSIACATCADINKTTYLIEGTVNTVGSLFTWLKQIGVLKSDAEIDAACRRSKESVFFLPALAGLAAPHWKSDARGVISGLTGATKREDIIRGAVEGIGFRMNDIYQGVPQVLKQHIKKIIATGGGANMASLIQFQADLFGKTIAVARDPESTVRGAAFLAGAYAGVTDKTQFHFSPIQKEITPQMKPNERARRILQWKGTLD
ncbi:MAG: FGGY family carbohydrate kinase [Nitrospirota bacterium]